MPLHDERLMVAIPLQCLFIIQMPNRRVLINALHYAWELHCSILNTFIRFLMFYLSNQPAIYSYSSQWVVALIQKQEHRMIFMMMMMMPWRCEASPRRWWLIQLKMGYLPWVNYSDERNYGFVRLHRSRNVNFVFVFFVFRILCGVR